MARQLNVAAPLHVEALRPYLEGVAKKLAADLGGPKGPPWGTTLTQLDDVIREARGLMSEKLLELLLRRQAEAPRCERPAQRQACPGCARPFAGTAGPSPRQMHTRAGEAQWQEPHEHCPRCRRAVFPAE